MRHFKDERFYFNCSVQTSFFPARTHPLKQGEELILRKEFNVLRTMRVELPSQIRLKGIYWSGEKKRNALPFEWIGFSV